MWGRSEGEERRGGGGVRGRRGGKRRGKIWRSEGRREGEHTISISSGSTLYPHCCGRPSREKSLRIEKKVTLQIMHTIAHQWLWRQQIFL